MSCAGIGGTGQYLVHVQGSSAVYDDSNQPGLQQALLHGCAGSTPNLTAYQSIGNLGYHYAPSGRSSSFSNSIQRASMPGHFALQQQQQQQQPQPVVLMHSAGGPFGGGMVDHLLGTRPCAASMHYTQQQQLQQHVLLEPAAPLHAANLGDPSMAAGLQAVLGVGGGATTEQHIKLQLLAQLQARITQQQQQLQYQHQAAGVLDSSTGAYVPSASVAATTGAARVSAPGCMSAAHDDIGLVRDQARVLNARASAAGQIPVAGNHPEGLCITPISVLQLQQQQPIVQQQPFVQQQTIMLQQAMPPLPQQQLDVMSPCAFSNTPTALAALPPGLLAELVGVDAAASVISRHWSDSSKGLGVSNSCRGQRAANITPRAVGGSMSSGLRCSNNTPSGEVSLTLHASSSSNTPSGEVSLTPHASSSMPGTTDVSASALHQQLQVAGHLANLHITAGSTGPLSGPLLHSSGSKGWDWASVGELLHTDSSASRSSVRRADSGLVSEVSIGSNIWGDGGGCHMGSAVPPQALTLAPCTASGVLTQDTSPCLQGVQRTSSSNDSCASHASDCGVAHTISTAAQPGLAHISSNRPDPGSSAASQVPPGGVAGATAAAAGAAKGLPAAPRASLAGHSSVQSAAPSASVDTLLRECAPKWAKAGWNPRSVVAAAPAAAARGTGAFVRCSSGGTAPSSAADSKPVPSTLSNKGTGAFIPPAVCAAVAAASGLRQK